MSEKHTPDTKVSLANRRQIPPSFQPYQPPPKPEMFFPDIRTSSYSHPSNLERDNSGSTVDFVFCNHSPANMGRVLEYTRDLDPDIVAIEHPGRSAEEALQATEYVNRMISSDEPYDVPAPSSWYHEEGDIDMGEWRVCKVFHGTGVQVQYIDINSETPVYDKFVKPAKQAEQKWLLAKAGDNPDVDALYRNYIDSYATSVAQRDKLMSRQIKDIVQKNPGKRIAVITGFGHTPLYSEIAGLVPSSKTFIPSPTETPWRGKERIKFSTEMRDIRRRRYELIAHKAVKSTTDEKVTLEP